MVYDLDTYYSALAEKQKAREQQAQLAIYREQQANARQEAQISARWGEFYARKEADEKLARIRSDSALQVEHTRQEGENWRAWSRQQHEQKLSNDRINADWNLESLRQRTALNIAQTQAKNALDVASENNSHQLASMVAGFFLGTLQKNREDESARRASFLRLLEKQADLRNDVFKMLITAVLGQNQNMSQAEASEAVSEVLKRWKEF